MKAGEAKSVATPAKSGTPFFNKGADTALLSDTSAEKQFIPCSKETDRRSAQR
jgi:hypothetical protein